MKKFVEILPTLTAPVQGEVLMMYLMALTESISASLFAKREEEHVPIYFVSRVLQGAELNYPGMEKFILALVHASRRLQRGDETCKDFLIKVPLEDNKKEAEEKANIKPMKTELSCEWKLFTDRAVSFDGSDAGLMLIDLEGKEYTYALSFKFETTNNEAEFTVVGKSNKRNQNKKADALSKLASMTFKHLTKEVLIEVLPKRSIEEKEILQVETKEGESWMTPIHEYLLSGLLPKDPKESRKIRVKAPQYKLIRGNMYRRSFYTPWLRCVASPQTNDIVKEVNEGSYGFNAEP
ncbi:reverse transcriptase domain-containing protein [Tanacetum coccineum]|uniref:Reverse transcriptase domain-containing protein n=1 Tax=Tanacetum coccineum TaxID=301880 RepID=A0ABQ5J067_9ASTR